VKLTERGTVSNSIVPSPVVMTMSLSPRVKVETGTYSAIFFRMASRWSSASETSLPAWVPEMTARLASWNRASSALSSPTAVAISPSAWVRNSWSAVVPSFSERTTCWAASITLSPRLRLEGVVA